MKGRIIVSTLLALLLFVSLPMSALAATWDIGNGDITVNAESGGQTVRQGGGAAVEDNAPVIKGSSTENTVTINAEKDQTANVTLSGANIDVSSAGKAAVSTTGEGNVNIELNGSNALKSGHSHAGLEKNNDGNLTIQDKDKDGSLNAKGGQDGAGIGGGSSGAGSDITITGGKVTARGGNYGAGIGGGAYGNGSDITVTGGEVTANSGNYGAGIGGGGGGEGKKPLSAYWRLAGFVVGFAGAIVFAALRATAVITQRTFVNYPTLWCCVVFDVAVFVVVILARRITTDWHRHRALLDVANLVAALAIAATTFRALPDVILRLTIFVEPGDPIFTSDMLLRALGFALGAAVAIIAALIFRTMRSTAVRWSFTTAVLLLVALLFAQHFTDLAQILQSKRIVSFPTAAFLALVWGINHQRDMTIAMALVFVIPAIASIVMGFKVKPTGANEAIARTHIAFRRRAKAAGAFSLVAMIGVTVALTYGVAQTQKVVTLSPPEEYSLADGVATIKFSQVSDGHLHRFQYKAKDGTVMRFIIIKKNGGAYGVGLDACDNCGDAGYYEKDGKIICKKCDVAINLATIGFKGGCNPIPFDYQIKPGKIVIQTSALDALSSHFQ